MFISYQRRIIPLESFLYFGHHVHCNVGQNQNQIMLKSYPYILFASSTLSILQRLPISIFIVFFFCLINILFTCLTLSKSQCWPTLSRHCVFIVPLHYCLHRHLNQHQVDIVIMTEMESTSPCWSCRHCIYIVPILSC